jgi:hypothetical protein
MRKPLADDKKKQQLRRKYILAYIIEKLIIIIGYLTATGFVPAPIILACLKKYGVIAIKSFIKGISFAGSICLVSFLSSLAVIAIFAAYHLKVYVDIESKYSNHIKSLQPNAQIDDRALDESDERKPKVVITDALAAISPS